MDGRICVTKLVFDPVVLLLAWDFDFLQCYISRVMGVLEMNHGMKELKEDSR